MKQTNYAKEKRRVRKKTLFSAVSMLLISSILLVSATYAWLILSVSPEVTGVATNVGANGSLEIALLNKDTYQDPSSVSTGTGSSLLNNKVEGNYSWGNLIDLNDESFGLTHITLMPGRLDITPSVDPSAVVDPENFNWDDVTYTVDTNILSVPVYGYDGRIVNLTDNTVSAPYKEKAFTFVPGTQEYGVRAIGTYSGLSVQGAALANAKANIVTYTNNARTEATKALKTNGESLFSIVLTHSQSPTDTFDASDLKTIENMIAQLRKSVDNIDLAVRQALVAYIASEISDVDTFNKYRDKINSNTSLDDLVSEIENEPWKNEEGGEAEGTDPTDPSDPSDPTDPTDATVPSDPTEPTGGNEPMPVDETVPSEPETSEPSEPETSEPSEPETSEPSEPDATEPEGSDDPDKDLILDGVRKLLTNLNNIRYDLDNAETALPSDRDRDGDYTWDELEISLNYLMNTDKVYINETLFSKMTQDQLMGLLGKNVVMTLGPGSGVYADIADFTGDYSAIIEPMGMEVEITTLTTVNPPYLTSLYTGVKSVDAAGGSGEGSSVDLSMTYGYALDMAFRCNAPLSDLLLQTEALQRVYGDSESGATMGGGSYMEFTKDDDDYSHEQMINLMDSVRVAFMDNKGTILGIAKLNVSNRETVGDTIKAPLYLYDFTVKQTSDKTGWSIVMGERRKTDNAITSLDQSVAKAVSVVVWLDGDIVDNSMVASSDDDALSLRGVMNLQFASSADLIPADNIDLLNVTADTAELEQRLAAAKPIYERGQNMYTSVSWDDFVAAYEYASAINENSSPSDAQVLKANTMLAKTMAGLVEARRERLLDDITRVREWMGTSSDPAYYVLEDTETGDFYVVNPYTLEQMDNRFVQIEDGIIYQVDYNKNLKDEGGGLKTPIYTDDSWQNMAQALYHAELVAKFYNTTVYTYTVVVDPDDLVPDDTDVKYENIVIEDGRYVFALGDLTFSALGENETYGFPNSGNANKLQENDYFTVKKVSDGLYTIQDRYERYLYMDDTHYGFYVSKEPTGNYQWGFWPEGNGKFSIINYGDMLGFVSYDPGTEQWGYYNDVLTSLLQIDLIPMDGQAKPSYDEVTVPDDPETTEPTEPEGTEPTIPDSTEPSAQDETEPSPTVPTTPDATEPSGSEESKEVTYEVTVFSTTFRDLDDAITALDVVYNAMERCVYYIPYDYNGEIYYFAVENSDYFDNNKLQNVEDTYGKWYDSNFNRIVSDLMILKLDAGAELAQIADFTTDQYIEFDKVNEPVTLRLDFLSSVYPELANDQIVAVYWNVDNHFTQMMTSGQKSYLQNLITRAEDMNRKYAAAHTVGETNFEFTVAANSITVAKALKDNKNATKKNANDGIVAFEKLVVSAEREYNKYLAAKDEASITDNHAMTANDRTVLTAAINAAKASEYYDNPDAKYNDLRSAVSVAGEVLKLKGATHKLANDTLDALNTEMSEVGLSKVTAYNTIQYYLPIESEIIDVNYCNDNETTLIRPAGIPGKGTITAVVYTKMGVVFKVSKVVSVYVPSEGVQITHKVDEKNEPIETLTIKKGGVKSVDVSLIPSSLAFEDSEGNVLDLKNLGESIKSCTWSCSDSRVLSYSSNGASCTLKGESAGSVVLTVSVTTAEGNTYKTNINVTVQ